MTVTKTKKLASLKTLIGTNKFFDYRPFTRVVRGLKAYRIVVDYIELNNLEAEGELLHREGRLRDVRPDEGWMFL